MQPLSPALQHTFAYNNNKKELIKIKSWVWQQLSTQDQASQHSRMEWGDWNFFFLFLFLYCHFSSHFPSFRTTLLETIRALVSSVCSLAPGISTCEIIYSSMGAQINATGIQRREDGF